MSEKREQENRIGEIDSRRRSTSSVFVWLLGLFVLAVVVLLLLPAVQMAGKWRPTQAWINLDTVGLALDNYRYAHGTLPYDARGPEYALYALADCLPATCFDGFPRDNPKAEAWWDHDQKRLVNSDFEYLNREGLDGSSRQMIMLAEKPHKPYTHVYLVLSGGIVTYGKSPSDSSRVFLGNWETSDNFLIIGVDLFRKWEAVPLPRSGGGSTTSKNSRRIQSKIGDVTINYEYRRGELVRRIFHSPEGTIIDTVTTDELGRIIEFTREPKDWESFWPMNP